jgi:hypothetical protein
MFMDYDRRVQEIVEEAEKALAALAAEAASDRDYQRASMLIGIAQRVAGALRQGTASKQDSPTIEALSSVDSSAPTPPGRRGATLERSGKNSPAVYPRFKREGDTLIKVGWSKSDRATYEHKSPRSILDCLVARIAEIGSTGERFTTEQILPLLDDDNAELPSYQAYLCLAWLVVAGLLERHGRQGYTISANGDFHHAVEAQWEQLPSR